MAAATPRPEIVWYGHLLGRGDNPSLLARRYRSHGHDDELSQGKRKSRCHSFVQERVGQLVNTLLTNCPNPIGTIVFGRSNVRDQPGRRPHRLFARRHPHGVPFDS